MPTSSPTPIKFDPRVALWTWMFADATRPPSQTAGYTSFETGTTITYAAVAAHSTHISTALVRAHGFRAGDVVSIFGGNSQWWPIGMYAVVRAGGIVSGASPAYGVEEMVYALRTAGAKWVFTLPESLEVAVRAAEEAGVPRERVVLLEGFVEGYKTLQDLVEVGKGYEQQVPPWEIPEGKTNHDIPAFLSFSSGTTGLPKAVMLSHQNMLAQCIQMVELNPPEGEKRLRNSPVLAALPFFHIMGLVMILHLPVFRNAPVIMVRNFTFPAMLTTIVRHKITDVIMVPPLLLRLIRDPSTKAYDLSHVKVFSSGAAPLSEEIITQLSTRFPNASLKQGYGMTETASCITATREGQWGWETHVGIIVPGTTVSIVDPDTLQELPPGVPGELLAKGPQVAMGYFNNAKATAETFLPGGWIRTGDQAVLDTTDLTVRITDRLKEMVKVNGVQIAPAEIEDCLLRHPRVEDAAVVGVADESSGERCYAFVVPSGPAGSEDDKRALREDIVQWVRTHKKLRAKWVAAADVEFVSVIPKSASGKILRKNLRAVLKEREAAKKIKAKL
ncbi:hypothetical protein EDC01DRAFT_650546 [Geopyxis carbonaria]|nr:hypothetical protein EDC01DRAFT_650546 [Geopyxis carbonaria]